MNDTCDGILQDVVGILQSINFSYTLFWEQLQNRGYVDRLNPDSPEFTSLYIMAEKAYALRTAQVRRLLTPIALARFLVKCYFFNAVSDSRINQKKNAIYEACFLASVGTQPNQEKIIQVAIGRFHVFVRA
jgi:hypothetical protein